jgi:hypothetical protein
MTDSADDRGDLIHLVSRGPDRAQIRLGDCRTVVSLRVAADGRGGLRVLQSHWINTPDTRRPRRPQAYGGLVAGRALGAAINEMAHYFSESVKEGRHPDESWFVPAPALAPSDEPTPIPPDS